MPDNPWESSLEAWKKTGGAISTILDNDFLKISYGYLGTEADLVNAILNKDGNKRIAIHDLHCGAFGESCAGSATTVVPLPAAVWLFGSGLMGIYSYRQRQSKFKV